MFNNCFFFCECRVLRYRVQSDATLSCICMYMYMYTYIYISNFALNNQFANFDKCCNFT